EFVYADLRLSPNIEFGQYLQPAQGAVGAGDKVVAPQIGGRVEEAVSFLQCDLIVRVHRELVQVTLDSGQFQRLQPPADRVSLPGEILIADALGHFQVRQFVQQIDAVTFTARRRKEDRGRAGRGQADVGFQRDTQQAQVNQSICALRVVFVDAQDISR